MSNDDKIADRLIEGGPYEEALITTKRLVPLSLAWKIRVAVLTLACGTLLAPAMFVSRDRIVALEGFADPGAAYTVGLSTMAFLGVLSALAGGALLCGQAALLGRREFDVPEARRFLRQQDFFAYFVLQGTLFILLPTAVAVAGAVWPASVETLYGWGVAVYEPGGAVSLDARLVSALSGASALALFVGTRLLARKRPLDGGESD